MVAVGPPARRGRLDDQRVGARERTLDSVSAVSDARERRAMGEPGPVATLLDEETASRGKAPRQRERKVAVAWNRQRVTADGARA